MTDEVIVDIFACVREVERLIATGGTIVTDIYLQAIANVTGIPYDHVPLQLRGALKVASFGARFGASPSTIARTAGVELCARCGSVVPVGPGRRVLDCWPRLTPYTKRDQTTRVEGYNHTVGRRTAQLHPTPTRATNEVEVVEYSAPVVPVLAYEEFSYGTSTTLKKSE